MMAVELGGTDLKGMINHRSILGVDSILMPGEPNELMYLKQAQHYMKKSKFQEALIYIKRALEYNPESSVSRSFQLTHV